jgi:hypothetical protein
MGNHPYPTGDGRRPAIRTALIAAGMGALCGCTVGSLKDRQWVPTAPSAGLGGGRAVRTTFHPTIHGWRLANRFVLGRGAHHAYGLCGGLCFAALDYWGAGLAPPRYKTTEELPRWVRWFLWRRQLASMAPRHLTQLASWALRSDEIIAVKLATVIVPQICAAIEVGRPTPVMLVRTRGLSAPWNNHQAVVYGYRWSRAGARLTFETYDPNHPSFPVEIVMALRSTTEAHELAQSTGEPLRGLFPLRYRWARPRGATPEA